jgi:arabinoxylan arabinofuranohydrolase
LPTRPIKPRQFNEIEKNHYLPKNIIIKKAKSTVFTVIISAAVVWLPQCLLSNDLKLNTKDGSPSPKLFNNPIIAGQGVCDPHIHIFNGKAYLFATHDYSKGQTFYRMDDWWIWSSSDLVNWTHEFTLKPEDMWVGYTKNCWAVDGAERNGKNYFYVSGNWHTGVAVSTNGPAGPYKNALGKALYTNYDPTVFIDDDENKTPYLITGGFPYLIGKLNDDMVSLAEEPKAITHTTKAWDGDGGWLHKRNGIYYLNGHGCVYSTSTNIYGPYTYRGKFFPNWIDHPTIFSWNNQSYCTYGVGDGDQFYRKTFITYVHYKANGDIVADTEVAKSFIGVGQYDCSKTIQAEWYFAASDVTSKQEGGTGFVISNIANDSYLYYPKVLNVAADASVSVNVSSENSGGTIEVHQDEATGTLLGTIKVPNTGSYSAYQTVSTNLSCRAGTMNICLVFKGAGNVANMDWFTVSSTGRIPAPPQVLPVIKPCVPSPTAEPVSAYNQIEAESFICNSGVQAEPCKDTGEGKSLGFIQNLANCAYKVDFGPKSSGSMTFQARVASGSATGGNIEIRLDNAAGPLMGTCVVTNTGGWQAWTTTECKVSAASGVHNLYLVFTGEEGYLLNLNWIKFTLESDAPTAKPTSKVQ